MTTLLNSPTTDTRLAPILADLAKASDPTGEDWFDKLDESGKARVWEDGLRRGTQSVLHFLTKLDSGDGRQIELMLHTGNKVYRRHFTRLTGVNLGTTEQAARDAVRLFVGAEVYDRQRAEREEFFAEQERQKQAKADAEHAAQIAGIKTRFPVSIHGSELLDLARHYKLPVNLRVQGTLKNRVSEVQPSMVRMSGGGNSIHIFRLREQVAKAIAGE